MPVLPFYGPYCLLQTEYPADGFSISTNICKKETFGKYLVGIGNNLVGPAMGLKMIFWCFVFH